MPQQLFIGIEHTVEMGRKRMHRVNYAKQQIAVAREEHTVFVNTFKRDALLAFQECWMLEQQMRELGRHIDTAYITGSISEAQHRVRRYACNLNIKLCQRYVVRLADNFRVHRNCIQKIFNRKVCIGLCAEYTNLETEYTDNNIVPHHRKA